tara:strand:+ start:300 stop:824 length:525 start_codon:yes stop_codon:yes gene_type:complete
MIRRLIILLLIIGWVFANESVKDSLQVAHKEKNELFQQKKKSPIVACALSLTPECLAYVGAFDPEIYITLYGLPALGHKYSNNWLRGVSIGLGITALSFYGLFSIELGYAILGTGYLLQVQDAIYLVNQYNAGLYEEIYGEEYIRPPKKSIIQKLINKKGLMKLLKPRIFNINS